jgi:hypothetical protein
MISRLIFAVFFFITVINITAIRSESQDIILTPQKSTNEKWGYVDEKGDFKIRPQFETAMPFKEELAVISVKKKFGYINMLGKAVIHPQFDDARSFSEELAAVMIYDQNSNKKWGFINKTGRFLIKPLYDDVTDFSGLMARVELDGKTFSINKSGEAVTDTVQ